MFMLENHLSSDQNRVVAEVQAAAGQSNVNLFLTGGAMRDMLGGFRIRDLDFSVEGQALKLANTLAESSGVEIVATDETRRTAELLFRGGVTASIGMARQEKYPKAGGRPVVTPATIQEDLRGRDFSVNAIALSLNRASRGLLLDPTNGLADLERRELRALSPYVFFDDPIRLLRLVRLRVRLGFTVDERTQTQFDSAREAGVAAAIPARARFEELQRIASEPSPGEVLRALAEAGLLSLFAPLDEAKLDLAAMARLEKAGHLLPPEGPQFDPLGLFLHALTGKLTQREKSALAKSLEMAKPEVDAWQKLELRGGKLEQTLKSARVKKPSQIYHILSRAEPDEIVFLLYQSSLKPVQERIRNYLQKYLAMVQEIEPAVFAKITAAPGTARYEKAREDLILHRLDHPPRKRPVEEPPPVVAPPPGPPRRGRPPAAQPPAPAVLRRGQ